MRDDKISVSAMKNHLKKMNVKCSCGAGLDSLYIEGEKKADICTTAFMPSSQNGMRGPTSSFCGPFAMLHCKRCGRMQFYFITNVLDAIKSGGSNGEI